MALLEVTGISKNFGSTHVLQNISLNLEKGEALAIIGSSGSGKTTLLRCLNFLETPDFHLLSSKMGAATGGSSRDTTIATTTGNATFSKWVTGRRLVILMLRCALVVRSFMTGG